VTPAILITKNNGGGFINSRERIWNNNRFSLFRFRIYEKQEGDTNLSICGTATSTIEDHVLRVVTNPKDKSKKIVMFNYKVK
jgi:hypothetical protein